MDFLIEDEAYFQSMQENLDELVDGICKGNACEKDIEEFCRKTQF